MTPASPKMSLKTPMLLRAFRVVCASVLMFSGLQQATAQTPVRRLSAVPAASAARTTLPGSVSEARLQKSQALGQLPGETQLQGMALYLKPTTTQDAEMTQLIADQQNPASPSYHQWLTPAQFGTRFGLADADLAVLTSWLQARGFTVESVAPSRNRIVFSGTSAAVESAFVTTMQRYQHAGRPFYENSTAVQVPAALADVIGGITGLSSYRLATPQLRRAPATTAATTGLTPQFTTSTGGHYLVPWDFRQIYGVNTLINAGFNGSGIKIGVIGQSAVDAAQLAYFQQKTGIAVNAPTMTLVPSTGVSNKLLGDEGESELDLEYSNGTAPGASINFIYTGCTSTTSSTAIDTSKTSCNNNGVFDALAYAIINNLAPILTLSYGGCESDFTSFAQTGTSPFEGYLKQSNTQGQTVLISSGDEGAATCDEDVTTSVASNGLTVSYPASSPYVTGVGGTTLNSNATTYWSSSNNANAGSAISYMPETSWNDTVAYKAIAASGGGASKIFAKPSWQAGTGVPTDSHRDVPDVAFPANVSEFAYYTCTVDGACTNSTVGFGSSLGGGGLVGGTSVAAPNFAAMLAVIEQANGGGSLGNVNPILYTLAQSSSYSTIFHDITTGNNIVNCTGGSTNCSSQTTNVQGTMGFSAGLGYDQVTGLGSIDAPSLRTALQGVTAKTPALALTVSSVPAIIGSASTFTLTVSPLSGTTTPTGNVQFAIDGTNVGSAVALTSGVATYSYSGFTTAGSHTVTATYAGDASYNSGTANVTVTATLPVPTVALTPANSTVALSTAVTFTATVSGTVGTPTGTIQFQVGGQSAGSPVALVSGVASYTYPGTATSGIYTVTATYSGSTAYSTVTNSTNLTVGTVPTFTLAATPTSLTVASGSTGTETLTVTPSNFSGTVSFTYSVATNSGATFAGCLAAASSTVTLTGTTPVPLALTVRTSAANCSGTGVLPLSLRASSTNPSGDWHRTGFALVSAAGLLGCFLLRRRLQPGLLMVFVLTALTVGMTGCSSSGSTTASTTATTGGNYTITLNGTSGSTTASTSFTLVVQ